MIGECLCQKSQNLVEPQTTPLVWRMITYVLAAVNRELLSKM